MQSLPANNMVSHPGSETALAVTSISLGIGKLMEFLTVAEPVLASLSYLVAMVAGAITIYFKFKRKQ